VSYLAALYERFWARASLIARRWSRSAAASAIDTAKALMVGTASGRFDELVALLGARRRLHAARIKALVRGCRRPRAPAARSTPWATIWDRAAGSKHSLHLRRDLARRRRSSIPT
jgi:hypothetical protein